ncbi:MAG: polysaccharide biosynthesis C-terminal domain-containing protein, partial [Bacteroidales bacterium]
LLGVITLSGMTVNIILNLLLIPAHHAAGASWAALCTQTLVALACVAAVEKTMFRLVDAKRVLLYLLMLLITFAAGRLLRCTGMAWITAAALQLITGMAAALAFRMIAPLKSLKLIVGRPDSI